ncbi:peptidase M56 [Paenibacillus sp. Y412MC10]|uniref:peptidase M56 n=1 Tax=Geobacillus sp. (strain Y412MC10) TaxID=481743 RepID=UPI0016433E02|nr:peptidase M56 [Paenibacillus sp. Y412MC10]
MIPKYNKGRYMVSVAVIVVLIIAAGAVLLTQGNKTGEHNSSDQNTQTAPQAHSVSFKIERPMDWFKWFHSLDRAADFSKFEYKVPDYLPDGYQLRNVDQNMLFSTPDRRDLLDVVTISFVSQFGNNNEQNIEIVASKGPGNMLEQGLLWGAPRSSSSETVEAPSFQEEQVTLGHVTGVQYTKTQGTERKPNGATSFVWQDGGVSYAINYYSGKETSKEKLLLHRGTLTQEDLAQIVQSFVLPQQVQHIRYDGEGNSFPLYDETDLTEAQKILGFQPKFPMNMPDTQLKLIDSTLLRPKDQNTGFDLRPSADTLWNIYSPPYDSTIYDLNDQLWLYESKQYLVDPAKLPLLRKLEIDGVEIMAYNDNAHVYFGPFYSGNGADKTKIKTQTYYLWKRDGICYTAVFIGLDKYQEENLKTLILAPSPPLKSAYPLGLLILFECGGFFF